jgi:hypothetical protein
VLAGGQFVVASHPRPYKSREQKRRPHRIHQAKSHRLEKDDCFVKSAHGLAAEQPLLRARQVKFGVGHDFD